MKNKFTYTYTAPSQEERREIDNIRRQYEPTEKTETKLDRLRRLDARVKNTANLWGLVTGVLGVLIFGTGLACVLEFDRLMLGIILSAVGAIPTALAYTVYAWVLERQKKKYGKEIVRLSEELLAEEK